MKSSIRTQIMTAFVAILTLTMVLCIGLNNGLLKVKMIVKSAQF